MFYSDIFKKSIPREKKKDVEKLLIKLKGELVKSNSGIFGTSRKSQSKKFAGTDNLYKFRVSDSDRIIFGYSDSIKNYRDDEKDGLYLFEYVSHDDQNRVAKLNKDYKFTKNESEGIDVELKSTLISEESVGAYKEYNNFDFENVVSYIIDVDKTDNGICEEARVSDEQYKYIENLDPQLVIGGAGSGKTLIALHKAASYRGYGESVAYFTFSDFLVTASKELYNNLNYGNGNVEFKTVKGFCIDQLDELEQRHVGYERFSKEFYFKYNYIGIDSYDVWAEIRGIIKGYMGSDWYRNYPFAFTDYSDECIRYLRERKFIISVNGNNRSFKCNIYNQKSLRAAFQRIYSDESLSNPGEFVNSLERIYQNSIKFSYKDIARIIIDKEEYFSLDEQASVFSKEDRKKIYDVAVEYENWLYDENLYDDNNLAGRVIDTVLNGNDYIDEIVKFDFIVVDEVQDLTEIQILMLCHLVEDIENLTFSGDIHQIINPTYFSNSRLKKLYYCKGKTIYISHLTKNYRSQKSIVDLANVLSKIRQKYIAKEKNITEQLENAIIDGNMPFSLRPSTVNLKQMVSEVAENPKACIVIADDEDRDKLRLLVGKKVPNIFTIQEVKGLEFEYVFCYNLTTTYSDKWEVIFSGKAKRMSEYRYYFNIFYVAITRAKMNLCIYEDTNVFPDSEDVLLQFRDVSDFDVHELGLDGGVIDISEWIIEGGKLEKKEKYQHAIMYFEKAKSTRDIQRCKAKLAFKAGEFSFSIDLLLEIKEYKLALDYAIKSNDQERIILCKVIIGEMKVSELEDTYSNGLLIEKLMKYMDGKEYSDSVYENYFEVMLENSEERINSAIEQIALI